METIPTRLRLSVLLLPALTSICLSQVHIKERVVLGQSSIQHHLSLSQAAGEVVFVAPLDGNLQVTPISLYNYYVPAAANGYVEIRLKDTSITTGVLQYLQTSSYYELQPVFEAFWCHFGDPRLPVYSYEDPKDTACTLRVSAGDTLRFFYHGEVENATTSISSAGRRTWDVRIGPYGYPPCSNPGSSIKFEILYVRLKYPDEILLGQSNYYYVHDYGDWWELKDDWDPSKPAPERSTSVQFTVEPISPLDKLAVYWEEKKPMPNGQPLPDGIIRLVGRYLDPEGKVKHKVKLTVTLGEWPASFEIEVVKPSRLGDNDIARSRRIYLDIEGKLVDVDSLCNFYGGVYGIPPQLIKGQIQEECAFSRALQKLVPSYRFEPYTIQVDVYNASMQYQDNAFFVRGPWDTQMGRGKCIPSSQCPPEHKNVSFIPYILYPRTVWDFVYDYSQLATIDPPRGDITPEQHAIYGKRTADGQMDFGKETYSTMQGMYDKLYKLYDDRLGGTDKVRAADLARELMASTMRDQWNGVGWQNIVAQTRIASSYGLLQMLYTTAIGPRKYPTGSDNRPEDINDTKTCMDFSMKHLDDLIKKALRSKLGGKQNDWPGGFEGAFRDYIYPRWNKKKIYPESILLNSLNHLPQP